MYKLGIKKKPGGAQTLPVAVNAWTTVPPQEIYLLTRHLEYLLKAGVEISAALESFLNTEISDTTREVIWHGLRKLEEGSMLSNVLRLYPQVFSRVFVGLIRTGEQSGNLEQALGQIAVLLEKQRTSRQKLVATITYPIVVLIVSLACLAFFFYVALPSLQPLLEISGRSLPWLTQMLFEISRVLKHPYCILVTIAFLVFLKFLLIPKLGSRYRRNASFRYWVDSGTLSIWLLGPLLRKRVVARILFGLATMIDLGLPLSTTLELLEDLSDNEVANRQLRIMSEEIAQGASLSEAFSRTSFFPNSASQMVAVGEEAAGNLPELLRHLAHICEQEADYSLETGMQMLEPALLVGLGLVVAVLALAILLPLISVIENL